MAIALPDGDGALVRLASKGNLDAFSALYERYFPAVFDFLTRLLRNREEAADVAQDTFVKAMEQLPTIRDPERFKSWVFTIAHRQGLNRIRRSKRLEPGTATAIDDDERATMAIADPDPTVNPEQMAASQEAADIVWEAAAGLDPRTYTVMDLHVRQGLGSAEIAEVMGVSKGNAYTMVSRMKRTFSDTLATYLLVQKGRDDCGELATIVPLEADEMTPGLRKKADRHVGECDACAENRRLLVAPIRIFATLLLVPIPAGLKAAIWETVGTGVAVGAGAAAAAQAGGGAASGAGAASGSGAGASAGGVAGVQGWVIAVVATVGLAGTIAAGYAVFGGSDGSEEPSPPPATVAAAVEADPDRADETVPPTTAEPGSPEEQDRIPTRFGVVPATPSSVSTSPPPPTNPPPTTTLPPPPTTTLPPPTTTTTTLPPPTTTTLPPPTTTTLPPPTTTTPPSPNAAIVGFVAEPSTIYATLNGSCPEGPEVSVAVATVDNPAGVESVIVDHRQREPSTDKGALAWQWNGDRIVANLSVPQADLGGLDQAQFDIRVRMTDKTGAEHEARELVTVLSCF